MTNKEWTEANIPNQHGKHILITGANCGLGYESARALAAKGAHVTLACRSAEKANEAKEKILKLHPGAHVDIEILDLSSLKSIRTFSENFLKKYQQLDVLMNNAGIMTTPFHRTEDGFEGQIGVNHFGHFALTGLLLPLLNNTPNSRIVIVSSLAHKSGKMHFDNLNFEDESKYTPFNAYQASKLANLLFAYELQRRLRQNNSQILVAAAHPGAAMTELVRHVEHMMFYKLLYPFVVLFTNNAAVGALPQLLAATDPSVEEADYYGPNGYSELRGYPKKVTSTRRSHNEQDARRLWEISEKLTEVRYL